MHSEHYLVLFDCDGTLVDSQHAITQSMQVAFEKVNLPKPDENDVRRTVGLSLHDGVRQIIDDVDDETYDKICQAYSQHWRQLRHTNSLDEPLYPGADETVRRLHTDGWVLGMATGKSHRGLIETLTSHQLLDCFHTLQTADRTRGKPHPEMVHVALDECACEAKNTILVGDTTFDMDMARSANVTAVGVNWGYHDQDALLSAGAVVVVDTFADLLTFLNDWKNT